MQQIMILLLILSMLISGCEKLNEKVYYVNKVKSYYPHANENAQVKVVVYKSGKSGHVEELFCEFPPNFILNGNEKDGWTGIEKVRVKGKARDWLMGSVSYYCVEEK